jgi:hypothetical protein
MKFRAILMALALAACGQTGEKGQAAPEAPEALDPFQLNIEIGRYGVMLSHVQQLTRDRPGVSEVEVTDPRDLARRLRETAWEYNLERSQLCARGLFAEVACGPTYDPVWLSESATVTPTLEEIRSRTDALGDEVTRFWNAVCDDARSRIEDEQERMYVCALE